VREARKLHGSSEGIGIKRHQFYREPNSMSFLKVQDVRIEKRREGRAGLSSVMGMCVSVANPRVESTPGSWAVRQGMVYARSVRNERWNAVALESMKRTPSVSVSLRMCVLRMSLHAAQPIVAKQRARQAAMPH
jgi:hypothetical protein